MMRSSLYPTVSVAGYGPHLLPAGYLALCQIALGPGQALRIIPVHIAFVQDHSIRAWLSKKPNGESLSLTPSSLAFWHPNRTPDEHVVLCSFGAACIEDRPQIRAAPGIYWLNLLNLINTENAFILSVETI